MTEQIISREVSFAPPFYYSVQTVAERKKGGGMGVGPLSYWKHAQIEDFLYRQLPVLAKRGSGCLIDLHAGDGLATPHPQPDLFAGGSVKTTPALAISAARKYRAKVILCEANRQRRAGLFRQWRSEATIIGNHQELLKKESEIAGFPWVVAISDPNGYGEQGFAVMKRLAEISPVSDFIIVVNITSLIRPLGLKPNHPRFCVRASRQSGVEHQWMLDPEQWKARLGKRQVLAAGPQRLSNAMTARVLLVSNFIPGAAR